MLCRCDIILPNMEILVIRKKATREEIQEMLKTLDSYIKIAVDIEQGILAGGGIMHADCEAVLLEHESKQENIWGANWDPVTKTIEFDALINIRPRQNNRKMQIQDFEIRSKVEQITRNLLELA